MDFTKGDKFRKLFNSNSVGFMDVWVEESPKGIEHPAARPVNCWKDLIELTSQKGEVILDPFAGSGTTGLCCKITGRKFVLIEKDRVYCKMIENRLIDIFEEQEEEKRIVEQIGLDL
jgi:site-specific DNA-methyltransferase (adenine-specific)